LRRAGETMSRLLRHGDRSGDEIDVFAPLQRPHFANAQTSLAGQTYRGIPLGTFGLRSVENPSVLLELPLLDLGPLDLEEANLRRGRNQFHVRRVTKCLREHSENVVDPLSAERSCRLAP